MEYTRILLLLLQLQPPMFRREREEEGLERLVICEDVLGPVYLPPETDDAVIDLLDGRGLLDPGLSLLLGPETQQSEIG
jgi:hypothetical protein